MKINLFGGYTVKGKQKCSMQNIADEDERIDKRTSTCTEGIHISCANYD